MQNEAIEVDKKQSGRTWSLWVLIVLAPAIAIAISTYYVFPESFKIIGIMLLISVGVSAWIVHNSDEPLQQIRRFGLIVKFAVAIVMFLSLAVHVQVSRELSAANHSRTERHEEEDRAEERRDKEARRRKLEAEARAAELAAAGVVIEQQRKLNYGLRVGQRKAAPVPEAAQETTDPLTVPTPTPKPPDKAAAIVTPESVREYWSPWMFLLAILDALIAIVGGARLLVLLHWDGNGNDVPDWMERLTPEELWARSPEHYAKLYGQRPATNGTNLQPPTSTFR